MLTFNLYRAVAYVDGTTQNPLVTSFNASVRSDLVVFSSDNNATIKRYKLHHYA